MSQRTHEWLVLGCALAFWALNGYQAFQPTNQLYEQGVWGAFLIILPILSFLLAISVIPVVAIHLGVRGGWKNRGPVFLLAQVACWGYPLVYLGLAILIVLLSLAGVA